MADDAVFPYGIVIAVMGRNLNEVIINLNTPLQWCIDYIGPENGAWNWRCVEYGPDKSQYHFKFFHREAAVLFELTHG